MSKVLLTVMLVCLPIASAAAQGDADAERIRRLQGAIEAQARAEGRAPLDRETIERMFRARMESRSSGARPSGARPSGTRPAGTRPAGSGAARSSKAPAAVRRFVISMDQARFLQQERVVYRVKHLPALDLAKTVNEVLMSEAKIAATQDQTVAPVKVVPEQLTNSLIVNAPADLVDGVLDLIENLDRQQRMVSMQILLAEVAVDAAIESDLSTSVSAQSIGELAAKLHQRPGLRILDRPRLAAIEGQTASLALGRRVPRITGTRASRGGRRSNSVSSEEVGLALSMTTRVAPDGLVTIEIDLEKSHLGTDEEGTIVAAPTDGEAVRTPLTRTFKTQTTVRVADGQTAILGGIAAGGGPHPIELILLVSPRIIK